MILERKRFLSQGTEARDRRQNVLLSTREGESVLQEPFKATQEFDTDLIRIFPSDEQAIAKRCLIRVADL